MQIWLDGKLVDQKDAVLSVFDHGTLYGDGVFEGIRFYNNRVFRLDDHIERLFDSAKYIALTMPFTQKEVIQATLDTVNASGLSDGYIRIVVTRGAGSLGLSPLTCPKASLFIIADKVALYDKDFYDNGLDLMTSSIRRPTPAALSPQVKSLNYINNIMAKTEAAKRGFVEALMLNEQGNVAECTGDNIFIVKKREVYTPPVTDGALDGITRRVVLEICAELNIPTHEATINRYGLVCSDECFLTGTAAEVIPVCKLDGNVIGSGKPGVLTKLILAQFQALTSSTGTPSK
ncbi:MAG: branched-chain-amino-acid transaminase [Akkermansia sp.]